MTVYENFKSMGIDELADWLDEYGMLDGSPWINWFDDNYCSKCKGISVSDTMECGWCELNNKCKYFQDMDDIPDSKQMIKMWLKSEY